MFVDYFTTLFQFKDFSQVYVYLALHTNNLMM
jgi:hypothetical protein